MSTAANESPATLPSGASVSGECADWNTDEARALLLSFDANPVAAAGGGAAPAPLDSELVKMTVPAALGEAMAHSPTAHHDYSPTHFKGDVFSPKHTGTREIVFDPSDPPLPAAAVLVGDGPTGSGNKAADMASMLE
jgi:hypothetical protein